MRARVPGAEADLLVTDGHLVDLENGVDFFTAPVSITAGM